MGIIAWLIFGLIAGAIAKAIMPGDQRGGCLLTSALGIVGAVVGGWIGTRMGYGTIQEFNIPSIGLAVVGAIVVLVIFRIVFGRS
ncbi:MAG: GlsB/YeaQ/YmgE family stress response membrane protein [Prosthecobacter sp.]|nr:GlsB/YeaQ/YmgE family stress response membrane protein [Prosthecobacter sp.]